mmetsp:Transcript_1913/g.7023  ORF Transcript_1913/g.7023 Transcript_1913/m.7023 type:complete len:370 (-) Transcript_1913:1648-2757(-)
MPVVPSPAIAVVAWRSPWRAAPPVPSPWRAVPVVPIATPSAHIRLPLPLLVPPPHHFLLLPSPDLLLLPPLLLHLLPDAHLLLLAALPDIGFLPRQQHTSLVLLPALLDLPLHLLHLLPVKGLAPLQQLGLELFLLVQELHKPVLLLQVAFPLLPVLGLALLLVLLLVLEVVLHALLVQLHEHRDLLLTLGALKVVHGLAEPAQLPGLLLPLLDLLLDGLLPQLDLVHLLAIFELLPPDLGRLHQRPRLLSLLLLHLPPNALLLPPYRLGLQPLLLFLSAELLQLDPPGLLLLLLLLQHLFVLLLSSLDDDLSGQDALMLLVHLCTHLLNGSTLPLGGLLCGLAGTDHATSHIQPLRQLGDVVLDLVRL